MKNLQQMQQILKQVQQMQEQLQQQLDTLIVEASAGGGMVAVKLNGIGGHDRTVHLVAQLRKWPNCHPAPTGRADHAGTGRRW